MNLKEICSKKLKEKGLLGSKKHLKRLKWELDEIIAKRKDAYFLDLYNNKKKYAYNQNNLLIVWLLGIVPDFDINKEPKSVFTGDLPDVDIDYLPAVRSYIKQIWAPKAFGESYVCNIGSYMTFGLKSSLIDMARVHGKSRDEILAITKNLEMKDEDGKILTWDSAMKLHPNLKKYCEENPDVAEAAQKLLHRNRGSGVHAGGLIVSSQPLSDFVPLMKRKDDPQASAWVEGLHGQDLQPVGLVKFDLLVIANLQQIAKCCELIKTRHGIKSICAKPGQPDWSDIPAWRDNPKSLAMANNGDLKGIFQFDSQGIRSLVKSGGVTRFEDIVAYSALYRPGPMGCNMHLRYVERKLGREQYDLHPLLKPILGTTYGIMIFQEQTMKILNVVGNIPLTDCELVRKAISKKKIDAFIKYKEMFIINGQKNLNASEKEVTELFEQIVSFSEYGFNLSHSVAYAYVSGWLLYLKSHYPHEFFCSILSCENLSEKIHEYKIESKLHNVELHKVDINKSAINFELRDNLIYYGISNIKGIGEVPAARIIENQPYVSFEDFLNKFGTDASVVKPLLGLRCFQERDPITLWKFYDYYKDCVAKNANKRKRHAAALEKYDDKLRKILPDTKLTFKELSHCTENPFDTEEYRLLYDKDEQVVKETSRRCKNGAKGTFYKLELQTEWNDDHTIALEQENWVDWKVYKKTVVVNKWKALKKLWKKYKISCQLSEQTVDFIPSLKDFDPNSVNIDSEFAAELMNHIKCEEKYYGFAWIHELENSPNYVGGHTFDALKDDPHVLVDFVEVVVKSCKKTKSKNGKYYYQLVAEDENGQQNKINIWEEDWQRFSEEFKAGNLLRLRLKAPTGGFNTFTLDSNQIGFRRDLKRYPTKEDDIRVILYKKGEIEKYLTDNQILDEFGSCNMESDEK